MKSDLRTMIDVMGMGVWEEAKLGLAHSTVLSTKDMDDKQIRENLKILKKAGFTPHLVDAGGERGQVIQMSGLDNVNLYLMRRMMIGQENWETAKTTDGGYVTRVATRGMEFDHMHALNNALKAENMEVMLLQSKTLGPTLRVTDSGFQKLAEIRQDYASGKVKLIDKPKPELGKKVLRVFNRVAAKVDKFVDGIVQKLNEKPPTPPDPKSFAGIWVRDVNGNLVNQLQQQAPPMKPPGRK